MMYFQEIILPDDIFNPPPTQSYARQHVPCDHRKQWEGEVF